MGMKFRVVCRKLYDYVRYDLKEIAFPSSLPDPPHIKKRPKLTWKDKWCILKEATRLYGASWVRDIGPDLRPNDYKKATEELDIKTEEARSEPTVVEDFLGALKGGAEKAKPALQRLYMARASNYTDALKNYVESYKEGLKEHLEEQAMGKGHQQARLLVKAANGAFHFCQRKRKERVLLLHELVFWYGLLNLMVCSVNMGYGPMAVSM
ncbi:hypothetical protein E2562_008424 [Oryza meyeriana var. granulata]|uniref:Uncharacterized protein n=1 Tax=Oryza meyeriana var. granulata TaxID=110450 RepID=A0A6G1EI71_9ORYZ|nr:hypothetical protein E2562_008424 [Oryza meyeriana var. granulata]KAF0924103.1 hypothetical protein E2562_008424 [Oryza meyeriana var. granulata]KAF0924105.1 hypothetical protein E2562_008424 [Oryza meyeriana var. granulata]